MLLIFILINLNISERFRIGFKGVTMKALIMTILTLGSMFAMSDAEAARCTIDLVNGRGRTVDSFVGYGYDRRDACREAHIDCRDAKRSGYYRARHLTCEPRRGDNRQMVQRTCNARLTGPRGYRTIMTFTGRASGVRGNGVKQQACQRAMRQCRQYKERSGRYRARCEVDRFSSRY